MPTLTVSLVQSITHWHDAGTNRAHFEGLLRHLPETGDLVVLPEMFTTGFTMESVAQAESMDGPTVAWLQAQAQRYGRTFCGSVVVAEGGQYFNRALWVSADGHVQHYDKRHRFRMAGEHQHYAAGEERVILQVGDFRVCPQVCYDLRFPVWTRNCEDYDLLLYVANWPAVRQHAWRTLLPARAIENQCYVAAVNVLGVDGNGVGYAGGSGAWRPDGSTLMALGATSTVATVCLDLLALEDYRRAFPAWQDRDAFTLHGDNAN